MSTAPRVLVDLAGLARIPLLRPARSGRLRTTFASQPNEPAPPAVAAEAASSERAALLTLGRLVREGRVEFCSYSEFAAPDGPGAWRNTWRELLGEVPVTKIEPAVSRAELGEDVFRNLEQSGALVRLCTRLKQGEWPAAGAGAPEAPSYDVHSVERFRRMAARVQGHHLADLFHLWSAECAGCAYWLSADETFAALLRERVEPILAPALTCRLVRPERLLQQLGVEERDTPPAEHGRVVSMTGRRPRDADQEMPPGSPDG